MNIAEAWLVSTRPKTLLLSVFPFVLGALLAYPLIEKFDRLLLGCSILCALFIQVGTNLINDAYDVKRGADTETRLGPKRGLQEGVLSVKEVLNAGILCFAAALLFGIPLVEFGGYPILFILIVSVVFGYLYTGGPAPLAYHGLGELFVLVFFGVVSTLSAYYFQTGVIDYRPFVLGVQLGLFATLPIAINNLRDIHEDALVDKRTLAVRFGKTFGRVEITLLACAPFFINFYWDKPLVGVLPWLASPLAYQLVKSVWAHEPGKIYNKHLGLSILLYVAFSVLLIAGYLSGY